MKFRFNAAHIALASLMTATCLTGGVITANANTILYWPNREPSKISSAVESESEMESLEIKLFGSTDPDDFTIGTHPSARPIVKQGDDTGITYQLVPGAQMPGVDFDPETGRIEYNFSLVPEGSTYIIGIEAVRDGEVVARTEIIERVLRDRLVIDNFPADIEVAVGGTVDPAGIHVSASGGDQDSITWSLENAPDWLEVVKTGAGTAEIRQVDGREITEVENRTILVHATDGDGREETRQAKIALATYPAEPETRIWTAVSSWGDSNCGITSVGNAYCWGWNGSNGNLGNGQSGGNSAVPVLVKGGHSFKSISVGQFQACGLTEIGEAYCWGQGVTKGSYSTFSGRYSYNYVDSCIPVLISEEYRFTQISSGGRYACGIELSGETYCWGFNQYGLIGPDEATVER